MSSFANASGGHIVFGIEEAGGVAKHLRGLAGIDADQEILRLEQLARDGLRPPIIGLHAVAVPLATGYAAIVVHIPKSWNPPHQVTFQKTFRFYGRGSAGKYQLDIDELRSIFSLSEGITEKMHRFRVERLARIAGSETPTRLALGARMITHLLPLSGFGGAQRVDVRPLERDPGSLVNIIGGLDHTRFNADGFVAWSTHGYLQVFRTGCLEVVRVFPGGATPQREGGALPSVSFEIKLFEHIHHGKSLLQALSVAPPVVVMVSFVGVKGWRIGVSPEYATSALDVFDRDPLLIPETVIESFEGTAENDARPLLDATWNAAGWRGSPHYDAEGKWAAPR